MAILLERLVAKAQRLQEVPDAWRTLAGKEDLLRRGLREGVQTCHEDGSWAGLTECWNLLSSAAARQKISSYCAAHFTTKDQDASALGTGSETIETRRLHDNACGLIATALSAAAFQRRSSDGNLGEVVRWLRRAAALLGDSVPDHEPTVPDAWPASLEDLTAALLEERWELTATRYWTKWWSRKHGGAERKPQTIGIAATYGPKDGISGFVADLVLEVVPGSDNGLIEHPEGALVPLSERWLQTLRIAAGCYASATCWWVLCPDPVPWEQRAFFGDSHGGAAAWGFWHVGQGKIADDRVITLASLQPGPGWPDHPEALALGEVGGIAAKVKAIANCRRPDGTPRFDTIVVAGRDNEKEAKAVLGNNAQIRVKNLEADAGDAVA